jgi:hypothetical protein
MAPSASAPAVTPLRAPVWMTPLPARQPAGMASPFPARARVAERSAPTPPPPDLRARQPESPRSIPTFDAGQTEVAVRTQVDAQPRDVQHISHPRVPEPVGRTADSPLGDSPLASEIPPSHPAVERSLPVREINVERNRWHAGREALSTIDSPKQTPRENEIPFYEPVRPAEIPFPAYDRAEMETAPAPEDIPETQAALSALPTMEIKTPQRRRNRPLPPDPFADRRVDSAPAEISAMPPRAGPSLSPPPLLQPVAEPRRLHVQQEIRPEQRVSVHIGAIEIHAPDNGMRPQQSPAHRAPAPLPTPAGFDAFSNLRSYQPWPR